MCGQHAIPPGFSFEVTIGMTHQNGHQERSPHVRKPCKSREAQRTVNVGLY